MGDPIFWLGLSLFLVAVSLTAVFVAAVPALRELGRASRSAEKLFDTLSRELPPTLEAIRLTGMEITDLTEDVSDSVQSAGRVVQRVDQSLRTVQTQTRRTQRTTRRLIVGFKAAWRTFQRSGNRPSHSDDYRPARPLRPDRLPAGDRPFEAEFDPPEFDSADSYQDYGPESLARPDPARPNPLDALPPNTSPPSEHTPDPHS